MIYQGLLKSAVSDGLHALEALPADLVLDGLFDEADALEHIGDVVDAALLHAELDRRNVQVDRGDL